MDRLQEQFIEKLKQEQDTDYLVSLLEIVESFSKDWIIETLEKEIEDRNEAAKVVWKKVQPGHWETPRMDIIYGIFEDEKGYHLCYDNFLFNQFDNLITAKIAAYKGSMDVE